MVRQWLCWKSMEVFALPLTTTGRMPHANMRCLFIYSSLLMTVQFVNQVASTSGLSGSER